MKLLNIKKATIFKLFNDTMNNSKFPDELKLREVTPAFKKIIQQS